MPYRSSPSCLVYSLAAFLACPCILVSSDTVLDGFLFLYAGSLLVSLLLGCLALLLYQVVLCCAVMLLELL
jgi:hypothetical protein